jgi:hypothetical protein
MVSTKICGKPDSALLLFTPTYSHDSLLLAEATIEGGNELCYVNAGTTSRYLRAGVELGTVSLAEELKLQDLTVAGGLVNQLTLDAKSDRRAELLQQLNPKLDHLTPGQRA